MGTFRKAYGHIVEPILKEMANRYTCFHGSTLRDIFIDHVAKGKWAVDDHAEKYLNELVEEGVVKVLEYRPTVSQAAFAGLSGRKDKPGWVPGYKEHFWYLFTNKWN